MNIIKVVFLLSTSLLIGCANFTSIHRPFNVNDGTGALIDIKQRAIIVSKQTIKDNNNETTKQMTYVCAEPSPEALSAFAAETKLSVEDKATLANSFQEGSSFTGLRTQSIQLLRDGMYRLCEANMNGTISSEQYGLLIRRYQKNMVALLAIEQLTGVVKASSSAISTSSTVTIAKDIEQSEKKIEGLQAEIAELNNTLSDTQDEVEKQKITTKISNKEDLIQTIKSGISNSKESIINGSANASIVQNSATQQSNTTQISNAVHSIVKSIIETDDLPISCFNYMKDQTNKDSQLFTACNTLISGMASYKTNIGKIMEQIVNNDLKNNTPTSQILEKIKDMGTLMATREHFEMETKKHQL